MRDAVLKMDDSVIDREGIEKIQGLMPSEDELKMIKDSRHVDTTNLPLGDAEKFVLTLGSIQGLDARLKLWAFRTDFQTMEKEVCEPLKDLKAGMEILKTNETFLTILSVNFKLLSLIGA